MDIYYLGEEPYFFNNEIDDHIMRNIVLLDITFEEHLKRVFEYEHETVDGQYSFHFPTDTRRTGFINEMLHEHLFHEVMYIFDKAFDSYCKYSKEDENYILLLEKDIRTSIVVKYIDCDIRYTFDEFLVFLQNQALKRIDLKAKYEFVKRMLFHTNNYNAFIYFLNTNLDELTMEDIDKSKSIDLTKSITFNPFLDNQQDIINLIKDMYYHVPSKGLKINKSKTTSQSERLKRIFNVYYLKYYCNQNSLTEIYKILRIEYGHKFNEFTLVDDLSDLENEAQQNKSHVKRDLQFIESVRELYKTYYEMWDKTLEQ